MHVLYLKYCCLSVMFWGSFKNVSLNNVFSSSNSLRSKYIESFRFCKSIQRPLNDDDSPSVCVKLHSGWIKSVKVCETKIFKVRKNVSASELLRRRSLAKLVVKVSHERLSLAKLNRLFEGIQVTIIPSFWRRRAEYWWTFTSFVLFWDNSFKVRKLVIKVEWMICVILSTTASCSDISVLLTSNETHSLILSIDS